MAIFSAFGCISETIKGTEWWLEILLLCSTLQWCCRRRSQRRRHATHHVMPWLCNKSLTECGPVMQQGFDAALRPWPPNEKVPNGSKNRMEWMGSSTCINQRPANCRRLRRSVNLIGGKDPYRVTLGTWSLYEMLRALRVSILVQWL